MPPRKPKAPAAGVPCPIPVCPAKDVQQQVRALAERVNKAQQRIDDLEAKRAAMHTELLDHQTRALDPIRQNLDHALELLTQIWRHLGLRQGESA